MIKLNSKGAKIDRKVALQEGATLVIKKCCVACGALVPLVKEWLGQS